MGVYGYSSLQGLRVLELQAKDLKPDIVTVSFGRNDHVYESPDRVRMGTGLPSFLKGLYTLLSKNSGASLAFSSGPQTSMDGHDDEGHGPRREARRPASSGSPRGFSQRDASVRQGNPRDGRNPHPGTAPRRELPHSYVETELLAHRRSSRGTMTSTPRLSATSPRNRRPSAGPAAADGGPEFTAVLPTMRYIWISTTRKGPYLSTAGRICD